MILHTLSDLKALANEHDPRKARGFAERSGMIIGGGLAASETRTLNHVVPLTEAEEQMLVRAGPCHQREPRLALEMLDDGPYSGRSGN